MQRYENSLYSGQYEKAFNDLDDVKLLQKSRNRFLYLAEKGRTANLLGWYDSSNTFLNQADYFLEDHFKNTGDVVSSNLLNPMMETYRGEDFERFLVHFYKAINYLHLGNTDDAVVEARRISLENYRLEDAKKGKQNKYNSDAFSLILQGVVFEKAGRLNDAFISYRNAANLFLESNNRLLYGVAMPKQLEKDVLRTAAQLGFTSEVSFFEKAFNTTYNTEPVPNGELLIFWENGKAPVKQQMNPVFNLLHSNNQYYFVDRSNQQRYDLDQSYCAACYTQISSAPGILADLFRITLPYYTTTRPAFTAATAMVNGKSYSFEEGVDVSALANATLNERQGKEIAKALTRLLVKKLTEVSAGAIAKAVATKPAESDKKEADKTAEEKKKEQEKKDRAEAIGNGTEILVKLFNMATEKADTRNWQSLPASIQYVRIPLQQGTNEVQINFSGNGGTQSQTLSVESNSGIVVRQISLLR